MKKTILFLTMGLVLACSTNNDEDVNSYATETIDSQNSMLSKTINKNFTVAIGTQIWMKEDLNVSKYRNGEDIPQVQDPTVWTTLTTGAWCYYENSTANGRTYGKLYNWYAVNDPRGLAPAGWHIPSDAEWTTLATFLGGETVAGGKMKSTTGWNFPNTDATNSSGFTGLPGGGRFIDGVFANIGYNGSFWSSTQFDTSSAWMRYLYFENSSLNSYNHVKNVGFSVRCLKD